MQIKHWRVAGSATCSPHAGTQGKPKDECRPAATCVARSQARNMCFVFCQGGFAGWSIVGLATPLVACRPKRRPWLVAAGLRYSCRHIGNIVARIGTKLLRMSSCRSAGHIDLNTPRSLHRVVKNAFSAHLGLAAGSSQHTSSAPPQMSLLSLLALLHVVALA